MEKNILLVILLFGIFYMLYRKQEDYVTYVKSDYNRKKNYLDTNNKYYKKYIELITNVVSSPIVTTIFGTSNNEEKLENISNERRGLLKFYDNFKYKIVEIIELFSEKKNNNKITNEHLNNVSDNENTDNIDFNNNKKIKIYTKNINDEVDIDITDKLNAPATIIYTKKSPEKSILAKLNDIDRMSRIKLEDIIFSNDENHWLIIIAFFSILSIIFLILNTNYVMKKIYYISKGLNNSRGGYKQNYYYGGYDINDYSE